MGKLNAIKIFSTVNDRLVNKQFKMPVKTEVPWLDFDISRMSMDEIVDDMSWFIEYHDYNDTELCTLPMAETINFNYTLNDLKTSTDLKSQIRNHDCMWSGRCVAHPEKIKSSAAKNRQTTNTTSGASTANTTPSTSNLTTNNKISSQQIAPGRSLLLNSRINNNNNNNTIASKKISNTITKPASHVPTITTNDFLKDRELNGSIVRPDTPMSIDDDAPEFKHNIDLAACTMGSNHMSLVNPEEATPQQIITFLKEHLENTTTCSGASTPVKSEILPFLTPKNHSLTDVLQYLQESDGYKMNDSHTTNNPYDNDESDDDESDNDCSSSSSQSSCSSRGGDNDYTNSMLLNTSMSIEDSKHGIIENYQNHAPVSLLSPPPQTYTIPTQNGNMFQSQRSTTGGGVGAASFMAPMTQIPANVTIKQEYQATDVGDHCYTRCESTDALGVQTPSDSGEFNIFCLNNLLILKNYVCIKYGC